MSFARSASGPSGLSINTTAANSLTLPSSQAPAAPGGLFGSSNPTNAATSGTMSVFGGAQQPTGGGGGGGLFGASTSNQNTQTQSTSGSLFGGPASQQNPNQAGTGGGLFGGNSASASQPQQTGSSLFGGGNLSNQPQTQTGGGGLFGSTASQQKPSGPLFGGNANQPPQTTGGGSLFGATAASQQQQQGPQQSGGSVFGGNSLGGGGQQQQQQQPQGSVSAVRINFDNLRPRTRFDDLTKEVQDAVEQIDQHIQRVIHMKAEISEFMPQHERDIEQLGRDVAFIEAKFRTVQAALNSDVQTVKALQDMTKKNVADSALSRSAVDNLQLPAHYHQTGLFASAHTVGGNRAAANTGSSSDGASSTQSTAQDLITYFNRICDDIERHKRRLDEYRSAIERDMPGVENGLYEQIQLLRNRSHGGGVGGGGGENGGGNGVGAGGGAAQVQDQLGEVLAALRETEGAIVSQAAQIAETRERLAALQAGMAHNGFYSLGLGSTAAS